MLILISFVQLYKPEMMETLMREDPLITQKRRETVVMYVPRSAHSSFF